jgi:hypothetical protein
VLKKEFLMNAASENSDSKPTLEDRRKVVDELHIYTRHNMMMWVQWFTFFLTVNYVALGWFAGELAKKTVVNKRPLLDVSVLFMAQGVLGISGSLIHRKQILKISDDLCHLYDELLITIPHLHFPHRLYAQVILLGCVAMIVVIGVWAAFAFI